jgi:hypothetical protein
VLKQNRKTNAMHTRYFNKTLVLYANKHVKKKELNINTQVAVTSLKTHHDGNHLPNATLRVSRSLVCFFVLSFCNFNNTLLVYCNAGAMDMTQIPIPNVYSNLQALGEWDKESTRHRLGYLCEESCVVEASLFCFGLDFGRTTEKRTKK